MMRRAVLCCGLAFGAGRSLAQEPAAPRTTTLQLAAGHKVRDALAVDVDGDGSSDLVVLASDGADTAGSRRLAIRLQRESGASFVAEPDASLSLTPDVVAYAVADVHADAGSEVVLFAAQAVFAWRWRAEESARFVKLFDCELLWQLADKKEAFQWQAGVVDLDQDGLPDLALPFPGGWRVAFQRRSAGAVEFGPPFDLHVPEAESVGRIGFGARKSTAVQPPGSRRRVSFSFGDGGMRMGAERVSAGPLLRVYESVPAAQSIDWDADGDLDLMCMSADEVSVFVQEPRGSFSDEQRLGLSNPVVADRERELDVSYSASVRDLDGDRRADCVIFAGDKRSKDIRTQALVFMHAPVRDSGRDSARDSQPSGTDPLFGVEGVPTQLLVFGGFARALGFQDVDGDGLPDLLAGAIQPDLIDQMRTASTERIEAELYVYRNTGRGFAKRPELTRKLSLPASNSAFSLDFVGDITGDRMSELLVREERERLRLYATRRGRDARDAWTVVDTPVWELSVDPEAELLLPRARAPFVREVFVLGEREILCVRLR